MDQTFTFDARGNIVDVQDVAGFPQKKAAKTVDAGTEAGLKSLGEDFFDSNFRDITSRDNLKWGDVTKAQNGNVSIRYKYRVQISNRDVKIMNQTFTFDRDGKFVSVENVSGFPKDQ
jgi:hypothetical protein